MEGKEEGEQGGEDSSFIKYLCVEVEAEGVLGSP